ncbi:MAG: hypothetical protein JWO03_2410, partial [Bacteroidetes bacterium]|nr:hypothetical protein [Bacteroidota bacterium]
IVLGTVSTAINVGIGTNAPAYVLDATGSTGRIGSFTNTMTNADYIAVYGATNNTPYYGYGGQFFGGYMGSRNYATLSGTGSRYASYNEAWYGTSQNYGGYFYGYGGVNAYGIYATVGGASSTNYAGYFAGAAYSTVSFTASDEKLKQNIASVDDALTMLKGLHPKSYDFRTTEYPMLNLPQGRQYGFLASDVEKVIPTAVQYATQPAMEDPDTKKIRTPEVEFKAVNYNAVTPVVVGAIQEQQKMIDDLKKENELLKKRLDALEKK